MGYEIVRKEERKIFFKNKRKPVSGQRPNRLAHIKMAIFGVSAQAATAILTKKIVRYLIV